jgi:hypothetical protein
VGPFSGDSVLNARKIKERERERERAVGQTGQCCNLCCVWRPSGWLFHSVLGCLLLLFLFFF